MASSVYSTRFLSGNVYAGDLDYTVPEGFRAIVRDISAYHFSTGSSDYVYLSNNSIGIITWIYTFPSGNAWAHAEVRQVFEQGEDLHVTGELSETCHVTISGYLLTLP